MDGKRDYFARQRAVPDWKHEWFERQRVLVLGVGGIGCSVAMALARLGVEGMVLIDYDVVEASNLNRQVLFAKEDVGRRKVDAAADGLVRHNLRTEIKTYHIDAVKEWRQIVSLAKESTAVFNAIDFGEYFDYAVTSLCWSLSLSYASANSYGHSAICEQFSTSKGPCWGCYNAPVGHPDIVQRLASDILDLESLEFMPKDKGLVTQQVGSSVLPCTTAALLAVDGWVNSCCAGMSMPNWTSFNLTNMESCAYSLEASPDCLVCSVPRRQHTSSELYFGVDIVQLTAVPGRVERHSRGKWCQPSTGESSAEQRGEALAKFGPLSNLGEAYSCIRVPGLPTVPLLPGKCSSDLKHACDLPRILEKPLLKADSGSVTAFRSGNRSAVLQTDDNTFYRLKGCSNYVNEDGLRHPFPSFPLQSIEGVDDGAEEIRGCCFHHTVTREQYMSERVSDLLTSSGLLCGNEPVGIVEYCIPEAPLPLVGKYCGLFRTHGERRLSTHVLSGLERLLAIVAPTLQLSAVLALFPDDRLIRERNEVRISPTWSACCSGDPRKAHQPICLCEKEAAPPVEFLSRSWHLPADVGKAWKCLWRSSCETLHEAPPSLFWTVFWRLGREVGTIRRLLKENDINWGYFLDHNPFEPHCNSHPNNLVLLTEAMSTSVGCFLAPVDFDLSFERKGFLSPYNGEQDHDLFDSWLQSEDDEMQRALAGELVNSGVDVASAAQDGSSILGPAYEALKWALRDTLLCGYRSAMHGETDHHPLVKGLWPAAHALLRLALIMTADQKT